jgi:hypothetical protein
MRATELGNFISGVAIASSDFAQVFARHAIESIGGCSTITCSGEQFVKWKPIISPVDVEADALAKLNFINLAARPLVENVLVARENGFDSQDDGALAELEIAKQRRQIALRIGQGMVIADEDDSRSGNFTANVVEADNSLVRGVSVAKIAKVFASGGRVDGTNLTLDAGDGVELSGAAS